MDLGRLSGKHSFPMTNRRRIPALHVSNTAAKSVLFVGAGISARPASRTTVLSPISHVPRFASSASMPPECATNRNQVLNRRTGHDLRVASGSAEREAAAQLPQIFGHPVPTVNAESSPDHANICHRMLALGDVLAGQKATCDDQRRNDLHLRRAISFR